MTDRWWRAYDRSRNDPKLLKLSDRDFRGWYNIICTASAYGGELPAVADLAIEIRRSEEATAKLLATLVSGGLLDENDGRYTPHNWNNLQYKSDSSSNRVKQHRERRRNVTSNVTGNVSETDSESESESESDSVAKATDASVEPDMLKAAFDAGVKVLGKAGHSQQQARGLIGKWRKDYGEGAVLEALGKCQLSGVSEPVSFITACLKANARSTGPPSGGFNG